MDVKPLLSSDSIVIDTVAKTLSNLNRITKTELSNDLRDGLSDGKLYRVVYPKGVSGELVKHNGGVLSTMRDSSINKFSGQATFYEVGDVALSLPDFSNIINSTNLISNAINLYYLKKIDNQLTSMQNKLDDILDFLYVNKEFEIYSLMEMITDIYSNFGSIVDNDYQRIASITNIQRTKAVALQNISFYYHDIHKTIDATKTSNLDDLSESIKDKLSTYEQTIQLYGICLVLEYMLSKNESSTYFSYVKSKLSSCERKRRDTINNIQGQLQGLAKKKVLIPINNDKKVNELIASMQNILQQSSSLDDYINVLDKVREVTTSQQTFYIDSEGIIYK